MKKKEEGIDPHVHCRDGNQAHKETIAHAFEVANSQGIKYIVAMPNTNPPITSKAELLKYLSLVPKSQEDKFFIHFGLTADEDQLEEAVRVYNEFPQVISFKLYAGESVGDLAVVDLADQKKIYSILTAMGYTGVITVHCEKQSLINANLFDPKNPISHCLARPKEAEIASIQDQIMLVKETGFQGILYICHVSCPESVRLINEAKAEGVKIVCEVTPHHIMWCNSMLNGSGGLSYKTNPPLRGREDVRELRLQLKDGMIDCIGTDHAPHAVGEKLFPPYLSGFPSLFLYRDFVERYLPAIGVSDELIRKLTFDNICQIFNLQI